MRWKSLDGDYYNKILLFFVETPIFKISFCSRFCLKCAEFINNMQYAKKNNLIYEDITQSTYK